MILQATLGPPGQPSAFYSILEVHALAGVVCVITGAAALISKKRPGRHPHLGTIYYWTLWVVFATLTGLSGMRWAHDAYLFVLGTISFSVAAIGYAARRIRWQGWISVHILGMSLSYIVLLTAFSVDNGPRFPISDRLPVIVFWLGPSVIGLPLAVRAMVRRTHPIADLRQTLRALASVRMDHGPARTLKSN